MKIKNKIVFTGIVVFALGIFVGWLLFGASALNRSRVAVPARDMHQMGDGSMMSNTQSMGMQGMMDGMMMGLYGKTGDAFDRAFIDGMIIHHQGAVVMAQAVLATSQRPELIQLARDIISAQTREIEMMQEWRTEWFTR